MDIATQEPQGDRPYAAAWVALVTRHPHLGLKASEQAAEGWRRRYGDRLEAGGSLYATPGRRWIATPDFDAQALFVMTAGKRGIDPTAATATASAE